MRSSRLYVVAFLLLVAACDGRNLPRQVEMAAIRDSMERLNTLEDRAFALIKFEGTTGCPIVVGPLKELEAVEREAREAMMVGCAGLARSALVVAIDDLLIGSTDPWPQLLRYRNSAEACETLLEAEENRWPGSHD